MPLKSGITPSQDTGWGLIFRLNDLFREIEVLATSGKYDMWNYKLDRIWANLMYRNKLVIEDTDGEIKEIKLSDADIKIKDFIDSKIVEAKRKMKRHPVKSRDYNQAKNELYKSLMLKDVWIRKLMHENDLYIKEISSNPAKALWGGK